MRRLYLLCIAMLWVLTGYAQDTLLLMSGKEKICHVLEYKDQSMIVEIQKGKRMKLEEIDNSEVFSVSNNGQKKIIYVADTLGKYKYTPDEMYRVILGKQYARSYYSPIVSVTSAAVGVGTTAFGFFALPGPAAYTFFISLWSPKLSKRANIPDVYKYDPYFKEGYSKKSLLRKINNSLLFGYSAAAIMLTYLVMTKH